VDLDQAQIEQLWQISAGRLRKFLYRLVGNIDTANDLLSQTFLEAARHWRRYRGKGSRQAWLFGIARNLARLEIRRQSARPTEPLPPDLAATEAPEESTLQEPTARMWTAVSKLPEHLRRTLTLRLANEMSYEEIAAALDIPIGTVRSRLHQAVHRLRDELRNTEEMDR